MNGPKKAARLGAQLDFLNGSFVDLPFKALTFDFVFDMGCFHHVAIEDRQNFIAGIRRVLRHDGVYMLTAFSYRNGVAWNHFTRQQLIDLFFGGFTLTKMEHYPSVEGDGVTRFFYTVLMKKP